MKKGLPARLVVGDPLPDEQPILPTPEEVLQCCSVAGGGNNTLPPSERAAEGVGGSNTLPTNTATLQRSGRIATGDEGVAISPQTTLQHCNGGDGDSTDSQGFNWETGEQARPAEDEEVV